MKSLRVFPRPGRVLPDEIINELIRMLIGGRLPIVVMALTVAIVAAFALSDRGGASVAVLAAYIIILLGRRYALAAGAIRQGAARLFTIEESRGWLERYRPLMLQYGVAVGAMNVLAVLGGDWVARMVVVAEVFGLCAGQVARTPSQPRLCSAVVLSAAIPTGLAFLVVSLFEQGFRTTTAAVCIGLMILGYAGSSLSVIASTYRRMVSHLEAKHHLAGLARMDDLTGLPNRVALRESLEAALHHRTNSDGKVALHLLDLDGFKRINDAHGHPMGDRLLRAAAARLSANLRGDDVAFRLGGDEFAVIQRNIVGTDEIEILGRRLIKARSEPFYFLDIRITIGASDGTATADTDATECHILMECADEALYRSKARGKGTVTHWFNPASELLALKKAAG